MEIPVHDRQGNVKETIQFDESFLGKFVNKTLLHQALVMYEANKRQGNASTKHLRELAGSSKKVYRQKGTGRARMGQIRRVGSRGGPACHGPKPRDYGLSMPKQARRQALKSALLGKLRDSEVFVVDTLDQTQPKTKEMVATLNSLKVDGACLVVVGNVAQKDGAVDAEGKARVDNIWKSVRNIAKVDMSTLGNLNAFDVLRKKYLLVTREALEAMPQEMK